MPERNEHKLLCPECQSPMVLRETKKFTYQNGDPRPFYGCSRWPNCIGLHGAHPDGRPLGVPADKETRQLRQRVHKLLAKHVPQNKSAQSNWLKQKGFGGGHVGNMMKDECIKAIEVLTAALGQCGKPMTDVFRKEHTPLSDEQKVQNLAVKEKAQELYDLIASMVPEGERSDRARCIAVAKTELETAVMWAVKGITSTPTA